VKTIAIDIDDTLNNFAETLAKTDITYEAKYTVSPEVFATYLAMVRNNEGDQDELLSTEFSYFRQKIHGECFDLAVARPGGVEFTQWLKKNGWRIVICTHRDLRRTELSTRMWLQKNGIPFDYLFVALDKLSFCKAWEIKYLVDDHLSSIQYADRYGVTVFYPIVAGQGEPEPGLARGFNSFDEVRQWITE
jgi:hypothetical protein